jgi:hypothetical protein
MLNSRVGPTPIAAAHIRVPLTSSANSSPKCEIAECLSPRTAAHRCAAIGTRQNPSVLKAATIPPISGTTPITTTLSSAGGVAEILYPDGLRPANNRSVKKGRQRGGEPLVVPAGKDQFVRLIGSSRERLWDREIERDRPSALEIEKPNPTLRRMAEPVEIGTMAEDPAGKTPPKGLSSAVRTACATRDTLSLWS